jgi:dephospho-CoA kinase
MLKLKKIAITGGLAAGKSSVCRYLQELGAYTVSADDIVHQLLSPSSEIGKKIIEIFGQDVVKDGTFDRKKIANIAFSEPGKLQRLEEILHPAVLQEIQKQYHHLLTHNPPSLFVAEIPLLFETSSETYFDDVVVVIAPEPVSKQRFSDLPGQNEEQYLLRTARLLSIEEKIQRANFVIHNDGSKEQLKKQVRTLFELLVSQ